MPRSHPIDYPQVHPPTAQVYPGLAPPTNQFSDPYRFSWQNSSTELVSPSRVAEQELEVGLSGERDQGQPQSSVPPLPLLPSHLGETDPDDGNTEVVPKQTRKYIKQGSTVYSSARTEGAQQCYQQAPLSQVYDLRPDVPRNLVQPNSEYQQHHTDPKDQPLGPPLSYEASQAQIAYQQPSGTETKMHGQHSYPYDAPEDEMTAHALPTLNTPRPPRTNHVRTEDEKQPLPARGVQQVQESLQTRRQLQRPNAVYIGPDVHPLSPTSPVHHTMATGTSSSNPPIFPPVPTQPQSTPHWGGTWHNSLLSCSHPSICLPSLACPCIIYGRTQYRLSSKDPTNMLGYSPLNGSCIAWSLLCGVNVLLTAVQHRRVRKRYEMIEGSGDAVGDCVRSLCCCCCVVAQDEKEVKTREEGRLEKDGAGYQSPGAMVYNPPPI